MATMRAEVEMRKTRVHTGFHEDAERKRRLRHSERAHSRPNNPETWVRARLSTVPFFLCAEHVRQLGGASPLHNVMDVK